MSAMLVRMEERHRQSVIDIYNHFVVSGFAAYRERALPYAAFDRFLAITEGYPAFVAEDEAGTVLGFAWLHQWHNAECFARTAEITYFLHPASTRQGLGSRFLDALLCEAKPLGIDHVLASISSRNEASLQFHRTHGFEECGRFEGVGRKFGEDFGVVWMMRRVAA